MRLVGAFLCGTAALAIAAPASAQIEIERFARSNFNFSAPGARALAMGGAFTGLADDATAVESNPAGLTALLYPELSLEMRVGQSKNTVSPEAGGGLNGRTFHQGYLRPSFASIVFPTHGITLAADYAKLVTNHGTIVGNGYTFTTGDGNLFPYKSTMDWDVANFGLGAAMKLGESLSLGASGGVSRSKLGLDHARYGVNNFAEGYLRNRVSVDDSNTSSGTYANVGALLKFGTGAVGATYKKRPKFKDIPLLFTGNDGSEFDNGYPNTFAIKVPDAISVGVMLSPASAVRLNLAAEQVLYSQLAENMAIVYGDADQAEAKNYKADDGLDLRAGAEYALPMGKTVLALRAGVARLAPSNIYYTGPDVASIALWGTTKADSRTEISAGLGANIGPAQLSLAGVFGNARREFATSVVFATGRK